jgi:hypothetical protein
MSWQWRVEYAALVLLLMFACQNCSGNNTTVTAESIMAYVNMFADVHRGKHHLADFTVQVNKYESIFSQQTDKPVINHVAFLKTHKTGSSTLASVVFRASARNHWRMYGNNGTNIGGEAVKEHLGKAYSHRKAHYDTVFVHLGGKVPSPHVYLVLYSRMIDSPHIFTIIREPMSHALSYLCYMKLSKSVSDIEEHIRKLPHLNVQLTDLAIDNSIEAVNKFLREYFQKFSFVCLTEYFNECLVMMRRYFNWSFRDLLYMRLLDSKDSE